MPKYPDIQIELAGQDGNAFFILGKCLQAMRKAGLPQETRDAFKHEAISGDYDHLLQTCIKWFEIN